MLSWEELVIGLNVAYILKKTTTQVSYLKCEQEMSVIQMSQNIIMLQYQLDSFLLKDVSYWSLNYFYKLQKLGRTGDYCLFATTNSKK